MLSKGLFQSWVYISIFIPFQSFRLEYTRIPKQHTPVGLQATGPSGDHIPTKELKAQTGTRSRTSVQLVVTEITQQSRKIPTLLTEGKKKSPNGIKPNVYAKSMCMLTRVGAELKPCQG